MNGQRTSSVVFAILVLMAGVILVSACNSATPVAPTPTLVPPTATAEAATPTPKPTPTMGPVDLVKAYEDAFNRHDLTAAMGMLADNIIFEWSHFYTAVTRKETQALLENYYFGLNSKVQHTNCKVDGDQVFCKAIYSDDEFGQAAGLKGYHFGYADFTIQENKIRKITYGGDQAEDAKILDEWVNKFWPWLYTTYRSDSDLLLKDPIPPGAGEILSRRAKEFAATLE
jgi:hypothetical protein